MSADAGHGEFRELAAGYALNALDPADEERFRQHAAACPDCLEQIARFQEVAAALAETAPAAEPSSHLGDRILAATQPGPAGTEPADARSAQTGPAQTEPTDTRPTDTKPTDTEPAVTGPAPAKPADAQPGPAGAVATGSAPAGPAEAEAAVAGPGTVVPLRQRRRRLAAVAAAAAIVAGGIWGGLAATSGGTPAPLAACSRPHVCTEVPLVATASHQVAAKVVVKGHEVWMLPGAMTANPKNEIYVLWQITGTQAPRAVGSFTITTKSRAPIMIGGLAAPYPGTTAFAVSLEHGGTIPAAPSNRLAIGQVS